MSAVFLDAGTLEVESEEASDLDWSGLKAATQQLVTFDQTEQSDIVQRCQHHPIVITNKVPLNADTLQQLPELKLILVAATGYDLIDLEQAKQAGVMVCNVPNYSTHSVTQLTLALMLNLTLRLPEINQAMQLQGWHQQRHFAWLQHSVDELYGKTLGIIGHGSIGAQVSRVAEALGMQVLLAQLDHRPPQNGRLRLTELLPACDYVSLHCPLVKETRHLVNAAFLKAMRSNAFLINTARGDLINEPDLRTALLNRTIAGAGLDVLSDEPPSATHPLVTLDHPGLLITPHIGWASREARQRLLDSLAASVDAFRQGRQLNAV